MASYGILDKLMGYNIQQWKFLNESFVKAGLLNEGKRLPPAGTICDYENYYNKNMLELGCQELKGRIPRKVGIEKKGKYNPSAKEYFESIGINHTSIDVQGCHDSIIVDLRHPVSEELYDRFHIITNSGTTEHVVPLEGQYQAFKNIHVCTKVGGIMFHVLPGIGKYYGHCQVYYDNEFFITLAALNDYKIIFLKPIKHRSKFVWMGICLVKQFDQPFTNDKKCFLKYIQFIKKSLHIKHRKNKNKYMN